MLAAIALFLAALLGMEAVAWVTHRYVMHGPGWVLHASHHAPRAGVFELNDLYAVFFSAPAMALIAVGTFGWRPGLWLGLGITGYGLIYLLFHDGLVHRRLPLPRRIGWLRRQVQAHRLHHVVTTRDGAVSFGFLWAEDPRVLKRRLASSRDAHAAAERATGC